MENFDNSEFNSEHNVQLQLTETMKGYLIETAKWAKFIAIVGFVILGILSLFFLGFISAMTFFSNLIPSTVDKNGIQLILLFIGVVFYGLIIFFPSWYLFKFSTSTLKSIPLMDMDGIELAFKNLKSLFKFYGIFMIVLLSFYSFFILIAIVMNAF